MHHTRRSKISKKNWRILFYTPFMIQSRSNSKSVWSMNHLRSPCQIAQTILPIFAYLNWAGLTVLEQANPIQLPRLFSDFQYVYHKWDVKKWLHLCPPIFLSYFWFRWCGLFISIKYRNQLFIKMQSTLCCSISFTLFSQHLCQCKWWWLALACNNQWQKLNSITT